MAIRTLGTAGEKFRQELLSLHRQTVRPERILVYIAEGYARPTFSIGREEYVWVKKGMMAQRALPYSDITSDCILLLDDDVLLSPDSAARLLLALQHHHADCIGADTFQNHRMNLKGKVYAALTNWVLPHCSATWAFKMHRHGSFSYNHRPTRAFYLSQTSAGPAMLWRKSVFLRLRFQDELWIDRLGFAYGDDVLLSLKVYRNGYRLGVLYDSGITNLNAQTSSCQYRQDDNRMYIRTFASFAIWWRTCLQCCPSQPLSQALTATCYLLKSLWLLMVSALATPKIPHAVPQYLRGLTAAWHYVHSEEFRSLPPFVLAS